MTGRAQPATENPVAHIDPAWAGREALLEELAERHGTPLYVYDAGVAAARVALLRSALPPAARLYYSVKANPCPGIHRTFAQAGCGFEVASAGELRTVREHGGESGTTIFVGPAKSVPELRRARRAGAFTVVVESPRELERLRSVVREDGGRPADVLLRINPGQARGALRMGGSSQFGMSAVDAERGLELAATWPEVRVRGFHGFLASGLLDASDVVGNARVLLESVAPLLALLPEPMTLLDLGGGFGIPYHAGERALDLDAVRRGLDELVAPLVEGTEARVCFEAGRFLMGPAGVLLCRVVDVKVNGGRRFVVLDGGSNVCGLFAGRHTGRALPFQVLRAGAPVADPAEPAIICGPLCTPMDRLANAVVCDAGEGDLVVWHQCGAYGASAGLSDFLSFDRPYEVVIEHDRVVWQSPRVVAP